MPTQAEFQQVAADLFGVFADFAKLRTFSKPGTTGTLDPNTGVVTGGSAEVTESVPTIREDYNAQEVDGQTIQRNDFKLLVQVNSFADISPRTDSVRVDVDGVGCRIINAEKDTADAVWTLQVRAE